MISEDELAVLTTAADLALAGRRDDAIYVVMNLVGSTRARQMRMMALQVLISLDNERHGIAWAEWLTAEEPHDPTLWRLLAFQASLCGESDLEERAHAIARELDQLG